MEVLGHTWALVPSCWVLGPPWVAFAWGSVAVLVMHQGRVVRFQVCLKEHYRGLDFPPQAQSVTMRGVASGMYCRNLTS